MVILAKEHHEEVDSFLGGTIHERIEFCSRYWPSHFRHAHRSADRAASKRLHH
jgi:hypothetical protein